MEISPYNIKTFSRGKVMVRRKNINLGILFHLNISMHILHTVCSSLPKVLIRRNCQKIRGFFSW